ncbi:ribosomal protein S18-alanine N-acetyltransferase [Ostreibacterium oceani]|uniref:[Ribosomal protein bS18]-alanine N-acetyltransferase n=1 Tax=Ostreibacterium oceani TaxID=2654998 RepID=A0A6N7EU35_9GAMM|nr:ribosomal protein S18-alanine N-acetyltransferase [Ostreibacterium oceani]MPV86344.1 ribosomal-protein-alanine N-acetyltransferase [Ostreibacterium oceani]
MTEVHLRTAEPSDLLALLALEETCFSPADGKLTKRAFKYHLQHPRNQLVIAYNDQQLVLGYVLVLVKKDAWRLYSLAVHANYRKQGIAKLLLMHIIKNASEKHVNYLTLEVRESNQTAIALYQSLGFRCKTRLPDYYIDASGLRMQLSLKP